MLKPRRTEEKTESSSDFFRLMDTVFLRMGVSSLHFKADAYQLKFGDETTLVLQKKTEDWLELSTSVGPLIPNQNCDTLALQILALQHQQPIGPLVTFGLDSDQQAIRAFIRLRTPECHADDVLCALQTLLVQTRKAHQLLAVCQ